ncbi:hypothetical protein PAMA_011959 [Pampus argenteus]
MTLVMKVRHGCRSSSIYRGQEAVRAADTVTSTTMTLLPVLLLLLSLSGVAPLRQTYRDVDPLNGEQVECDRCPPGTFLRSGCTLTRRSQCAPCPEGSFTELWNYIGKCLRCAVCGLNQVIKTPCTANRDCECECKHGYYYKDDICYRHSQCMTGQGVQTQGTPDEDTVCHVCPNGTYSNLVSAQQRCMQHRSCEAAGLQLVLKGCTWHDNVCTSCDELQSKDGAEFLREILPTFFVHQRLSIRRLRLIVNKLSGNGKQQEGVNYSNLQARLNTWITSATATQLQDLPAVLKKTGANNAAEKLQNKMQRMSSHLKGLCVSERRD